MGKKYKNVGFLYVQPHIQKNDKDSLFDLNDWIDKFNELKATDSQSVLMEYDGDTIAARSAAIQKIGNTEYGIIHFVRYRIEMPAVAKITEEVFDILKLDDDTYIVEDFSVLFDRQLSIAIVQKNQQAFSVSVAAQYITEIRKKYTGFDNEDQVELRPVINKHVFDSLKTKDAYKSIELKTANVLNVQSPFLKDLFNSQKAPEGITITFAMSVGQSKSKELPAEFIKEVIEEVTNEADSLSVASVTAGKKSETKKKTLKIIEADPINLLQGKITDKAKFDLGISQRNHLQPEVIQVEMARLFFEKRTLLARNADTEISG